MKSFMVTGCTIRANEKDIKEKGALLAGPMMDALFNKRRSVRKSLERIEAQIQELADLSGICLVDDWRNED